MVDAFSMALVDIQFNLTSPTLSSCASSIIFGDDDDDDDEVAMARGRRGRSASCFPGDAPMNLIPLSLSPPLFRAKRLERRRK